MRHCLPLLLLIAALGLSAQAHAQPMSSADKVSIEPVLEQTGVLPGTSFRAALVLELEEGWHINAHQPLQEYFIGTDLSMEPHADLLLADTRYPEPYLDNFGFSDEDLAVYEGTVPIFLDIRASEDIAVGTHELKGTLRVQACDDKVCLAPTTVEVSFSIPVVADESGISTVDSGVFAGYEDAGSGAVTAEANQIAALFDERGWVLAFLSIFLIGLALNLTPCIYPMMSVTVALFGGQRAGGTTQAFGRASVYVLGIATMYSGLGVAAAYTGTLFGNWLQHPLMLAGIALLLFGLALSMFGLFEIQPPQWMTQKLSKAQNASGLAGLYGSGVVVGVFAAPCIGPPIIALLAFVGAQADPLFGFLAFFVLSLGLGLPYLILGTFSSLMHRLPKSGVWMVWVKQVFGVILVGVAFFYGALATYPALAEWVIPATLILGGIYLGFVERSGHNQMLFRRTKWAVGVAAIAGGLFFVQYLQQPALEWEPYSTERVAEAQAAGKPVMMDFYADWCIPCLELERVTFTDDTVRALGDEFVRLKVDLTQFNSPEAEAVREQYAVAGVPTIVFLDTDGEEVREARVVGFLSPTRFAERMQQAHPPLEEVEEAQDALAAE